MEYNEFCENVLNELKIMLGEDYTVKIEKIIKNNQVSYDAVIIMKKEKYMSPSVYLDDYYNSYKKGMNIADIALSIIVRYEKYKDEVSFDIDQIFDYESIKNKVYVRVVNAEMNKEMLKALPHMKYYDLAMIVYALIDDDNGIRVTMNVSTGNIKIWNITKEKLFKDAINNTRKKMPPSLTKMSDVMRELLAAKIRQCGYEVGEDDDMDKMIAELISEIESSEKEIMYMLTNRNRMDGAVYILFNDILEDIASELQSDLYILPSSIHEVLILPKTDETDYEYLCETVNYVNNKDLDPMEVLSESVYIYERGKGIMWENHEN